MSIILDPERELEQFLASLPSHERKALECRFEDMTEMEVVLYVVCLPAEQHAGQTERYMQLLEKLPKMARQHRERVRKSCEMLALSLMPVPPARRGRPRKESEAEEIAALENSGMSHRETADHLNKKYEREVDAGRMTKRTPGNVYQLLRHYYVRPNKLLLSEDN